MEAYRLIYLKVAQCVADFLLADPKHAFKTFKPRIQMNVKKSGGIYIKYADRQTNISYMYNYN